MGLLLLSVFCGISAAQSDLKQAGVCSRCHVVSVLEWQISAHSSTGTDCASCHGPSTAHVANERNEVSPDRLPRGGAADSLCQTCHTSGCPSTGRNADCLTCHNQHSLTRSEQIETFQGDRARHPIHEQVARLEKFDAEMGKGEALVGQKNWAAAKAQFEKALEIMPGDPRVAARIRFCARRLEPDMRGVEIVGEEFDAVSGLPLEVKANGVEISLRLVPAGEFDLGSEELADSRPAHTVSIGAFYLGKFEVTQQQWEALMGANPSEHKGPGLPVDSVSWKDAQEFIAKLNREVDGGGFRLPTEAEWEYAARAGDGLFKDFELPRYAWYRETSAVAPANGGDFRRIEDFSSHAVGEKEPNRWGLFDLHGNVWEWTSSLMKPYFYDSSDGRESAAAEGQRVMRGGGFADPAFLLNPALRVGERTDRRYRWNGLRVARDVVEGR